MFRFGMILTDNKPMRVTRQTASDWSYHHSLYIMHIGFKSGIIKTDISDHFPVFFWYKYIAEKEDAMKKLIYKHKFSSQLRLFDINWSKARKCRNGNEAYINFFNIIDSLYDECFPVAKIRLKKKKHFTPWIK